MAAGPLDRLRFKIARAIAPRIKTASALITEFLFSGTTRDPNFNAGGRTADVLSPYRQSWAVYAGARDLGRNMAGMPFRIMEGDPKQSKTAREVQASDAQLGGLVRLFESPSPLMSATEMWESIPIDFALYGEWIWLKWSRAENGRPAKRNEIPSELIRIRPKLAIHNVNAETGLIESWSIQVRENQYFVAAAESIIHHRLYNPDDQYRGLPMITAALQGIALDYKADAYTNAMLDNDGTPAGALKVDQELTQEQADSARKKWEDNFKGSRNKGKIAILPKGAEYISVAQTAKEMLTTDSREFALQEIKAVLGVTDLELGDMGELNYASASMASWWKWKNSILPMAHAVESALDAKLFKPVGLAVGRRVFGLFDIANVEALSADLGEKLDSGIKLLDMGYTADEVNDRLGLGMPTIGNRAIPGQTITVGGSAPGQPGAGGGGGISVGPGQGQGNQISVGAGAGTVDPVAGGGGIVVRHSGTGRTRALGPVRDLGTSTAPAKTGPVIHYRSMLPIGQRGGVMRRWNRSASRVLGVQLRGFYRAMRDDALEAASSDKDVSSLPPLSPNEVEALLGAPSRWIEQAEAYLKATMNGLATSAVKNGGLVIGGFDVIELEDPRWLVAAGRRTAEMVRVALRWRNELRSRILRSVVEGEGIVSLARAIDEEFGQVIASNGLVIARTETGMLGNQVRDQVFRDEGYDEKEWSSAHDGHTRESHEALDGERKGMDERFGNGLMYPMEPGGPPEEVIQCRCVALPVGS